MLGQDQDSMGGGFQDNQAFEGYLADLRVWDVVRTASEISEWCAFTLPSGWSNDLMQSREAPLASRGVLRQLCHALCAA